MIKFILNTILLFLVNLSFAQDTTFLLSGPVIIDSFDQAYAHFNHNFLLHSHTREINLRGPLSQILLYNPAGYVRSNGPGKVTTFTKHGLPAEHTKVTWQNIELNSILNGITDFSTIPSFLISNNTNLSNHEDLTVRLTPTRYGINGTNILFTLGSYEFIDAGIKHNGQVGKSRFFIGGQHIQSKNNFTYKNDLGQLVEQSNSDYKQHHAALGWLIPITPKSQFKVDAIYSDITTSIPPTIFQQSSKARQENLPYKISATYTNQGINSRLNVHYGAIKETLHYLNPDLDLDVKHIFSRHQIDATWQGYLKNNSILEIHVQEDIEHGRSDNFSAEYRQLNSSISAKWSKSWNDRFIFSSTIRELHLRDKWSPLQLNLSANYIPNKKNRIRSTFQTLYRAPTYNELYWKPGGNEMLSPESGYALVGEYFHKAASIAFELGGSIHRIHDRILWLPQMGGLFSPVNVGKIGSEEIYGGVDWNHNSTELSISCGLRYTYLRARILEDLNQSTDKKYDLPFTPRHAFSQHFQLKWKNRVSLKLLGKYQSKSFTNRSNTQQLESFFTARADLNYTINIKTHQLTAFITLNNINNETYYLANGYAQPPRHWQSGIILKLK